MAYIDVDKDIRYYTEPLEEKIEELQAKLLVVATSLNTINKMLDILSTRIGIDDDN